MSCRLVLRKLTEAEPVIIFEGIEAPATLGLKASRSAIISAKTRFLCALFLTNSAPMLLIDPSRDGQIVDANLAALNFYGYNHETMCQKHTWEINMLGRRVMPIMHEISHLPGGHKPLNFVHKLADGSTRHVQTYAGPIEIYGDKLMLCIVHDITEQKRLEEQLEHAAHHDAMTGLLNRRQFYHITEPGQCSTSPSLRITAYCSSTPIVLNTLTISMGILKVMRCYAPSPAPSKVALAKAIWCFVGEAKSLSYCYQEPHWIPRFRWLKLSA